MELFDVRVIKKLFVAVCAVVVVYLKYFALNEN